MTYKHIGIDISKRTMDIYWDDQHSQIGNDKVSIRKLIKKINRAPETVLAVCEPTGGYEKLVLSLFNKAGIKTHLAHANKIKSFSRAKGSRAKTDKIDAKLIYEYAKVMTVVPDIILHNESTEKMGELLKRRKQLNNQLQEEKNRLDKACGQESKNSLKSHIKWLEKEIKKLVEFLKTLEKESDDLKTKVKLLTSIPGVGPFTAWHLIAFLPELGLEESKKLSALVGVVPYNRDSGSHTGKRHIFGGRSIVRKALYMAAISAIRCYPEFKAFYQALVGKGKAPKVAIIAVVRKLITVINSVVKRQTPWVDVYA